MEVKPTFLVLSNDDVGARQLADFLNHLPSGLKGGVEVFSRELKNTLAPTTRLIHLRRSYQELPRPFEPEKCYRQDVGIRQLLHSWEHTFELDHFQIASRLAALADFIQCGLSRPDLEAFLNKLPTSSSVATCCLDSDLQFWEDRRLLLFYNHYLSPKARGKVKVQKESSSEQVDEILSGDHRVGIVVNARVLNEVAKRFLSPRHPGEMPSHLIVIFDRLEQIRHYLSDPYYAPYLASQRLKLWHESEWAESMHRTCNENIRSSIVGCDVVTYPPGQQALGHEVEEQLGKIRSWYGQVVTAARNDAKEYFSSSAFEKRLEEISLGAMPRVLVEQACHTVATKQFSRGIAKGLQQIGCEVYIHTPCGEDSLDYLFTDVIDMAHFQPDLVIRYPNGFGTGEDELQRQEMPRLPILLPLQDLEPHIFYPKYVKKSPLRSQDLLLIMQDRVKGDILEAGVKPEQLLSDFIPVDPLPDDICWDVEPCYDVGLVKTLHRCDTLQERAYPDGTIPKEAGALDHAEAAMRSTIASLDLLDLEECQALGRDYPWRAHCLTAYHEWLCIHFVEAICEYQLGLAGANWSLRPQLSTHAIGHLHDRKSYLEYFRKCRINLSINPWNEYHMRILDGGQMGAFFLVHEVPKGRRWCGLPEELMRGEHFDSFSSTEELKDKVQYYLQRPEERMRIGHNLQSVVRNRFSYERMARLIVSRLQNILRGEEANARFN